MTKAKLSIIWFFAAYTFCIQPAYAYLDPGTVNVVLQAAIAGIAACATVLSMYYQNIKLKFNEWFGPKSEVNEKKEEISENKDEISEEKEKISENKDETSEDKEEILEKKDESAL